MILFRNPYEALKFAYGYHGEQYERPLMNKMADKTAPSGKGLAGIDGAAQSGFIKREMKELSTFYEAIVIASFAPPSKPCACKALCCSGETLNFEWGEAIHIVTTEAMSQLSGMLSHYKLRRGIVEKQFGIKRTLLDLAEQCGVNRDTAAHHNGILTSWLQGDKKRDGPNVKVGEIARALAAADERLTQAGFIGEVE